MLLALKSADTVMLRPAELLNKTTNAHLSSEEKCAWIKDICVFQYDCSKTSSKSFSGSLGVMQCLDI